MILVAILRMSCREQHSGMSSEDLSTAFFHQLRALRNRVSVLQQDISILEATVSQVVTGQEDRMSELESWANPYANDGSAIGNWLEIEEID
jgi:hypothetical protein